MDTFTPGAHAEKPAPLALDRPKELDAIISSAWKIWRSKPSLFVLTAIIVVLPIDLVFVGLLGGGFDSSDGTPDVAWAAGVEQLLLVTAGTALITAIHARAVVALAEGRQLSIGQALQVGLRPFLPVLGAIVVYTLFIIVGFVALILPGIYLSIAGLFAGQSAALTRTGPLASFTASRKLVHANGWWRTFGYSLVLGIIGAILVFIPTFAVGAAADAANGGEGSGVLWVILTALSTAAIMSWTALATSLQYFSWRANAGIPFAHGGGSGAADGIVERDWSAEAAHTGKPVTGDPLD